MKIFNQTGLLPDQSDQPVNLAARAVKGGLWVALGYYFNVIFGFAANLILVRLIVPEHFGAFAYGQFFYSLFNLRNRIPPGFGFIQKKEINGESIGSYLLLNVTYSIGSVILLVATTPLIQMLGRGYEIIIITVMLAHFGIIEAFSQVFTALLDKNLLFGKSTIISSLAFPLSYIPAILIAFNNGGYWSLLAQNFFYAAFYLIGILWLSRRLVPGLWNQKWIINRDLIKSFTRIGFTIGLSNLATLIILQFDNFLIGTYVGLDNLGYYDRAYRIAQWPTLFISGVLSKTTIYLFAKLQDDQERLKKTAVMSFWIITTLGIPLAIGIFLAAPDLITFLYTDRWIQSSLYLRYLIIVSLAFPFIGVAGDLFVAMGQQKITLRVTVSQALVMIFSGFMLTLRYGTLGTCIAVGISFSLGLLLFLYYLQKVIAYNLWENLLIPAASALCTILLFQILSGFLVTNSWDLWIRILSKLLLTFMLYLSILIVLQYRTTTQRMKYIWSFIKS